MLSYVHANQQEPFPAFLTQADMKPQPKIMRSHLLFLCILALLPSCSTPASDEDAAVLGTEGFSITSEGRHLFVHHPSFAGRSYELQVHSGFPEILELRSLPSGSHHLLIYKAGSMGTSHHVHVSRAKVINVKTGEETIDEIWKYTDHDGRPDSQTIDPVWTFTPTRLLLKTSSQDEIESIPLR